MPNKFNIKGVLNIRAHILCIPISITQVKAVKNKDGLFEVTTRIILIESKQSFCGASIEKLTLIGYTVKRFLNLLLITT